MAMPCPLSFTFSMHFRVLFQVGQLDIMTFMILNRHLLLLMPPRGCSVIKPLNKKHIIDVLITKSISLTSTGSWNGSIQYSPCGYILNLHTHKNNFVYYQVTEKELIYYLVIKLWIPVSNSFDRFRLYGL